jgi:hypothetical protein
MLTYQLRERVFQFEEGATPTYPADAIVSIALAPPVSFGTERVRGGFSAFGLSPHSGRRRSHSI